MEMAAKDGKSASPAKAQLSAAGQHGENRWLPRGGRQMVAKGSDGPTSMPAP